MAEQDEALPPTYPKASSFSNSLTSWEIQIYFFPGRILTAWKKPAKPTQMGRKVADVVQSTQISQHLRCGTGNIIEILSKFTFSMAAPVQIGHVGKEKNYWKPVRTWNRGGQLYLRID